MSEDMIYYTYEVKVYRDGQAIGVSLLNSSKDLKNYIDVLSLNQRIMYKIYRVTNYQPQREEINLNQVD